MESATESEAKRAVGEEARLLQRASSASERAVSFAARVCFVLWQGRSGRASEESSLEFQQLPQVLSGRSTSDGKVGCANRCGWEAGQLGALMAPGGWGIRQ
jgi:hypothetical protein